MMMFFKHLGRLLLQFLRFAWREKLWWLAPLIVVLLLLALLICISSGAAPFIYTLF